MSTTSAASSIPDAVRRLVPSLRARKSLGQHFLNSRGILEKILEAAEVGPNDTVVEVGPGIGLLTEGLAHRARRVVAIELDDTLAEALTTAFRDYPNVSIVHGDARELDIAECLGREAGPYKVVANLPYYAALPILRRFLESEPKPSLLVVMVQREVAEAMIARPGSMSMVSLAVQYYGNGRIVCKAPPGAFTPPPKVTSAVVRVDVLPAPAVEAGAETFFRVARAGFSAPRKQIRNSLAQGLGQPSARVLPLLEWAGVEPTLRPEDLSLDAWGRLAQAYGEAGD